MEKPNNTSALAKQIAEVINLDQAESLRLYKELAEMEGSLVKDILLKFLPVIKTFGLRRCLNILAGDNTIVKDLAKEGIIDVDFSKFYPKNYEELVESLKKDHTDVDFSKLYPKNYEELIEFLKKDQKPEASTKYAACIKADCVRGARYSKWDDPLLLDDHAWVKTNNMPLFLEIVIADTPTRATQMAAARAGVSEDVIELIPV